MILAMLAANGLPDPDPKALSSWLLCLFAVIGILKFLLGTYNEGRLTFGRKPPIDDELRAKASAAHVEKIEMDVKGLVTARERERDMEENRLRWVGLQKEISEARHTAASEYQALKSTMETRQIEAVQEFKSISRDFKTIEGQMGALRSTTEHLNASIIASNQQVQRLVENLPQTIRNAINGHKS